MEAKLLDSTWFTTMSGDTIGIVIVDVGNNVRKAYIGKGNGQSIDSDTQLIAQKGAPVDAVHLLNFFKRHELIK